MAQYYGIYDYCAYSPMLIATLATTLPIDSRVARKYKWKNFGTSDILLMSIVDALNILIWQRTRDGHKGINKPKPMLQKLTETQSQKDELEAFESADAYEHWRRGKVDGK